MNYRSPNREGTGLENYWQILDKTQLTNKGRKKQRKIGVQRQVKFGFVHEGK